MVLKPKSNCYRGWEKGLIDQTMMHVLVDDQDDVLVFLIGKAPSWMNSFHYDLYNEVGW